MRMVLNAGLLLAAVAILAGCLGPSAPEGSPSPPAPPADPDEPMRATRDPYYDVASSGTYLERTVEHAGGGATSGGLRFHSWDEVQAKLEAWNASHPDLVDLNILGETRQGRPLFEVVVTNESVPPEGKIAPLLDGAHHGNEYAGAEIMLYTVDTLLENAASNATVRALLRDLEIHVVPVVNPDGWAASTRYNGFGVNLNRNYDLDWGNAAGTSNPVMGQVGAALGQPVGGVALVAENCGRSAFSEPETQAMRDLMARLGDRAAFYFTGHTPSHAVIAPWAAFAPPFALPGDQSEVLEAELEWIRTQTEYEAGKAAWGNFSAGLPYAASGSSMDYFYATLDRPAFTVEVEFFALSTTSDDFPQRLVTPYDGLRYWMDATLPIPMHLLSNARALSTWQLPMAPALVPPPISAIDAGWPWWVPGPAHPPALD